MKRSLSASSSTAKATADDALAVPHYSRSKIATLSKRVSPPPARREKVDASALEKVRTRRTSLRESEQPTTAEVEAGASAVDDHVEFFSSKLAASTREDISGPRLAHLDWLELYKRNDTASGHHFVIHQHDHPVAGTHYDLRLQINGTSSISFAIMYGLPGDPNSRRLNRNATETRVHCIWVSSHSIAIIAEI